MAAQLCAARVVRARAMSGAFSEEAERGALQQQPRERKRSQWLQDFKQTLEYSEALEFTKATEANMPAEPDLTISKRRWVKASERWTDAVRHLARMARQTWFGSQQSCGSSTVGGGENTSH